MDKSKKIAYCLEQINSKIDPLIKSSEKILKIQMEILQLIKESKELKHTFETGFIPDVMALLSLPSSVRKTMFALQKLGEATADDLSKETGKLRAVESSYANQLVRMGYIRKKRVGRKVVFYTKIL